jgi:glycogen debranching enzyme
MRCGQWNQVFALSLPYPLLAGVRAKQVLRVLTDKLLTPVGLRSLDEANDEYKAYYTGDIWKRDGSYHQGTVWSFLMGPYIDALFYVNGSESYGPASLLINNFLKHLDEAGIGTVSEIFDGAFPHKPKGCIAQAWGVGEVLRVIDEHKLRNESESKSF